MLTPLRNTDILKIKPDVDALDLFSENFKLSDIPAHFGCYAFYRKRDRVVIYIGSACADGISADSTGLRMRLGTYRPIRRNKSRSGTILKVREAHAIDPLLVCCWLCESEGDCRKYEVDAIRTHHPVLNQLSTKSRSAEEKRKIKRARARTYAEKPKNYNPTSRVVCRGCGFEKYASEFSPSRYHPLGIKLHCRKCIRENRAQKSGKLTRQQWRDTIVASGKKRCYGCKKEKMFKEFNKDRNGIAGLCNYCRPCSNTKTKMYHITLNQRTPR